MLEYAFHCRSERTRRCANGSRGTRRFHPDSPGSEFLNVKKILETGLDIMVPLFIAQGELIRVDTQTRKYLGKETETGSSPG